MKKIINKIVVIAFIVFAMSSCKKCDYSQAECETCPDGFVKSTVNNNCEKIFSEEAVLQGQQVTVEAGDVNGNYSVLGAVLYDLNDSMQYPISSSGSTLIEANSNPVAVNSTLPSAPWLGRLNTVGVWSSLIGNNEWVGFSACVEVEQNTKVCIGIGADNRCRFNINGHTPRYVELNSGGMYNFRAWHVFEFELQAGVNIIEMEGLNDGASAAFGAEIYRGDFATISSWVSVAELEDALIFSTKDLIGSRFQTGSVNGYLCPNGGAVDFCGDTIAVCTSILREPFLPCPDIVIN